MKKVFSIVLVYLLVCCHVAHAQAVIATSYAFERFMVAAKGTTGWTTGANALGQTVAMGPASLTKAYATAAAASVTPLAAGGATIGVTIGSAAAGSIVVTAAGVASGASVFATFRALIGGPYGLALLAAPAVVDWLLSGGYRSIAGTAEFEKLATTANYKLAAFTGSTKQTACSAYVAGTYPVSQYSSFSGSHNAELDKCEIIEDYHPLPPAVGKVQVIGRMGGYIVTTGPANPNDPENWKPVSVDGVDLGMRTMPSSRPLIDAILQASQDGKLDGIALTYANGSVTATPFTSADPAVKTVTKTNGVTTTVSSVKSTTATASTGVNAQGKTVPIITPVTTTTVTTTSIDDSTGVATTPIITTTTDNPNPAIPTTTPSTSTPADEPEPDLCEKNPDILACKKLEEETAEIPKSQKTITFQEESMFGGGSCPANLTASLGTLGTTVTVWDWQKTCQMALPLRAMVLALASFAAFLIVMPGETRT